MRSWLKEVLAAEEYQVLDVPTISAGLLLSHTAQIDLVITDIFMASQKGMRILLQQIQELLEARHLLKGRVIAIKHHFAFPPVFDVGKLFGIRASLVHPFTAEQMIRAVRQELWMGTRTTFIHRLLHKFALSSQHQKSFPSRRP